MSENDGFEVPVHRSLTEPILFAGVPRNIALINGTIMTAIGLGGQTLIVIPIGIIFHVLFAAVTKIDPNFFEVLRRNLARQKKWGA